MVRVVKVLWSEWSRFYGQGGQGFKVMVAQVYWPGWLMVMDQGGYGSIAKRVYVQGSEGSVLVGYLSPTHSQALHQEQGQHKNL